MQKFVEFTGPAIVLLYLIISSNFIADIFGCTLRDLLKKNTVAKHTLAYLTMLLFVTASTDWSQSYDFGKLMGYSFSYYLIFVLTTRVPFRFLIPILFLFTCMYYIKIYKTTLLRGNDAGQMPLSEVRNIYVFQDIDKYQQLFLNASLILVFIGFIVYFKNKKAQYGKKFSVFEFFRSNATCSHKWISSKQVIRNLIS